MSLQWLLGLFVSDGGGSIITTPVLVYVFGVEPHQAIGMSLLVVGTTSLAGVVLHHRRDTVDLRAGAVFGAAGRLLRVEADLALQPERPCS